MAAALARIAICTNLFTGLLFLTQTRVSKTFYVIRRNLFECQKSIDCQTALTLDPTDPPYFRSIHLNK